jgi:hypothetical protein
MTKQIEQQNEAAVGSINANRRSLMMGAGALAAMGAIPAVSSRAFAQGSSTWDKTFPRSEKVDHQKVTFKNRYGITLAGDLYLPKDRADRRLPALAIGGPFGAVKEQSSGLYAQAMAERGFVTVAFDGSYTGESGGEPRNVPRRTSIPRISAPPWTISACTRPLIASGSASSASAAGAAWR